MAARFFRIALGERCAGLALYEGRFRPRLVETFTWQQAEDDSRPLTASLHTWLSEAHPNVGAASFSLGLGQLRPALLPWTSGRATQAEKTALLGATFRKQYGEMPDWQFAVDSEAGYGHAALAFALQRQTMAGIVELCQAQQWRCMAIRPRFAHAWNTCRSAVRGNVLFGLLEDGQLMLLGARCTERGAEPVSARCVSLPLHSGVQAHAVCHNLLTREAMLAPFSDAPRILLAIPGADLLELGETAYDVAGRDISAAVPEWRALQEAAHV